MVHLKWSYEALKEGHLTYIIIIKMGHYDNKPIYRKASLLKWKFYWFFCITDKVFLLVWARDRKVVVLNGKLLLSLLTSLPLRSSSRTGMSSSNVTMSSSKAVKSSWNVSVVVVILWKISSSSNRGRNMGRDFGFSGTWTKIKGSSLFRWSLASNKEHFDIFPY